MWAMPEADLVVRPERASASERKVQTPQGAMPRASGGFRFQGRETDSATENKPPADAIGRRRMGDARQGSPPQPGCEGPGPARVKRCGKSAPRFRQRKRHGKPHREQDRIGRGRSGPLTLRVGCWRPSATTVLDRSPHKDRTRLTGRLPKVTPWMSRNSVSVTVADKPACADRMA